MLNPFSHSPRHSKFRQTVVRANAPSAGWRSAAHWLSRQPARYAALGTIGVAGFAVAVTLIVPVGGSAPSAAAAKASQPLAQAAAPATDFQPAVVLEPPQQSSVPSADVAAGPAPISFNYQVKSGDTVRSIAAEFGVSSETVMWANNLAQPDLLEVGQQLVVPSVNGVLHHADGTETLRDLADRFHGDAAEIAAFNHLDLALDEPLPEGKVVVPDGRRDDYVAQPAAPAEEEAHVQASGDGGTQVLALGELEAMPIAAEEPVAQPAPVPAEYEVREGDTLRSLALLFGVDVETLLNANNLDDPDTVSVGTTLRVLPVSGVEYTVGEGETLADIAYMFEVDGGSIVDVNGLSNPDLIQSGNLLIIPGAKSAEPIHKESLAEALGEPELTATDDGSFEGEVATIEGADESEYSEREEYVEPADYVSGGGAAIVENAMAHLGQPYIWGGVGPYGFDCSGFVYYIHMVSGHPTSRGLWGQLEGGPSISLDELEPGDTLFWANTYKAGLSHVGIYIGGGQFIHASDPSTGVTISSMGSSYWSSRYIGASRLW
jgi:peptidoglycan DL-endopeptidase LytE